MHLFNNQHTDSEKIASIKTNRIREIPGKKDEGRPCARYSGYDNACVPSPVSVAYSFLPVAEDITTLPPWQIATLVLVYANLTVNLTCWICKVGLK